jgi:hypothetical protein
MRRLALSIIVAFAVYVTAAVAQSGNMGGSTHQGTQGSSPTAQPGQTQPGQPNAPETGPGTMGQDQNGPSNNTGASKSEKKLKGCVQSQNGQYILETKKGNIALTGQDVSAHVGHEVAVKGAWQSGGSGNAGSSSSPTASGSSDSAAWSKGTFNVTDVEMVSETCKMGSKHSSSGMGAGAAGSGSTDSGSSAGTGTGSGTGTTGGSNSGSGSTTPPQ